MSKVQPFLYLKAVNQSSFETRSGSCLKTITDLKTEQCAVLMNFLELTIFANNWWESEIAAESGNLINLGTKVSAEASVWRLKSVGMIDLEK